MNIYLPPTLAGTQLTHTVACWLRWNRARGYVANQVLWMKSTHHTALSLVKHLLLGGPGSLHLYLKMEIASGAWLIWYTVSW